MPQNVSRGQICVCPGCNTKCILTVAIRRIISKRKRRTCEYAMRKVDQKIHVKDSFTSKETIRLAQLRCQHGITVSSGT